MNEFWAPALLLRMKIKELLCEQCGERELVLAAAATSPTLCGRCRRVSRVLNRYGSLDYAQVSNSIAGVRIYC